MSTYSINDERERVANLGKEPMYAVGLNAIITDMSVSLVKPFLKGSVLELGPAEGIMTNRLVEFPVEIQAIEGSPNLATNLSTRHPSIVVHNKMFEEFVTEKKFNLIIMSHVLEHVLNPQEILLRYANFLEKDGCIFIAVPNAKSIHRLAAVKMGLLNSIYELNERDISVGHRRVYDMQMMRDQIEKSSLVTLESGGYWLKPLSNPQIEKTWNQEMISAFFEVGRDLPEFASELYFVVTRA